MKRCCHVFFCLVLVGGPGLARAQTKAAAGCQNDMQCKGDRICVQGQCQDPGGLAAAPAASSDPVYDDTGWTMAGAIIGFSAAAAVGLLGAGSAATSDEDENIPSLPLGGAATVLGGVLIPIAAAGGGSGAETGIGALRVVGWISYGLFLANASVLLALGVADADLDYVAPILSTTALGMASSLLFAFDALSAHNNSKFDVQAQTAPVLGPVVGGASTRDGTFTPTLGLFARF